LFRTFAFVTVVLQMAETVDTGCN